MALRAGGGSGGVELIDPSGGGGGIQSIARPGESAAPNYAGMFSEAMRTALEPAKFMWGMYKDREELSQKQQELLMKGQELTETQKANRIREAQEEARTNLETLREAETERHNKIDETRAQAEVDRQKSRDEWEKPYYSALQADAQAKADEAKQRTEDLKTTAENKQHDTQVIDDLNAKLKDYGPMDHYSIQDHPELAGVIRDALRQIKTPDGEKQISYIVGQNTALGQELARHDTMLGWSTKAQDAFITNYNRWNQGPEAPSDLSGEQRFNRAFEAAAQVEEREMEVNGYWDQKNNKPVAGWTENAIKVRDNFLKSPEALKLTTQEAERTAMGLGRAQNERDQAALKKTPTDVVRMKLEDIQTVVDNSFPLKANATDEEKTANEAKKAQITNQAIQEEDKEPGGALKFIQSQGGVTPAATPTTTPTATATPTPTPSGATQWAQRNLGTTPPKTAPTPPVYGYSHTWPTPAPAPAPATTPKPATAPSGAPEAAGTPAPAPTPAGTPLSQTTLPMGRLTPWDYWSGLFNQPSETA